VAFERAYPATVNDPEATRLTLNAARAVAGEQRVEPMRNPTLGGEDFAFMLKAKQGSYIMLGGGRGKDDPMLHHPRYDFNDAILPIGASYWATLAEQLFPGEVGRPLPRSPPARKGGSRQPPSPPLAGGARGGVKR
jgi:hippurate hydrolase